MKTVLILFLTILLFYTATKAQKNLVSGFVVQETGDTIHGQIDDKNWSKNPTNILFISKTGVSKVYDIAKELKSFGVSNKAVYVTKTTSLDMTPHTYGAFLENNSLIISHDSTLILKLLVRGKISLYFLRDANSKEHFFVEKNSEGIEELIKHEYIGEYKGGKVVMKDYQYNNQLYNLCEDCSIYRGKEFNYQYEQSSLKALILEYNRFFGDNKAYETADNEVFHSSLWLQLGVGQYSYRTDIGSIYESPTSYFIPSFGLGWLVELPSNRKRISLKLDATYSVFGDTQKYSNTLLDRKSYYLGFSISPQYSLYKSMQKSVYLSVGLNWKHL